MYSRGGDVHTEVYPRFCSACVCYNSFACYRLERKLKCRGRVCWHSRSKSEKRETSDDPRLRILRHPISAVKLNALWVLALMRSPVWLTLVTLLPFSVNTQELQLWIFFKVPVSLAQQGYQPITNITGHITLYRSSAYDRHAEYLRAQL